MSKGQSTTLYRYRSVPQIHSPFAILGLVQNAGGAYTWDVTISLAITPSLLGIKSLSVEIGGQARGVTKHGALPSAKWRDGHDASGRVKTFSVEEQGSRALTQSSLRVHR